MCARQQASNPAAGGKRRLPQCAHVSPTPYSFKHAKFFLYLGRGVGGMGNNAQRFHSLSDLTIGHRFAMIGSVSCVSIHAHLYRCHQPGSFRSFCPIKYLLLISFAGTGATLCWPSKGQSIKREHPSSSVYEIQKVIPNSATL